MFEKIQTQLWKNAISTGIQPYTCKFFDVNESMQVFIPNDKFENVCGLALFLYQDYSLNDFKDYLVNCKEYVMMTNAKYKNAFFKSQLTKYDSRNTFLNWQYQQLFVALGIVLNTLQKNKLWYKVIVPEDIPFFNPYVKQRNAVLCEIVLYENI